MGWAERRSDAPVTGVFSRRLSSGSRLLGIVASDDVRASARLRRRPTTEVLQDQGPSGKQIYTADLTGLTSSGMQHKFGIELCVEAVEAT